jgi:hypothetical protein
LRGVVRDFLLHRSDWKVIGLVIQYPDLIFQNHCEIDDALDDYEVILPGSAFRQNPHLAEFGFREAGCERKFPMHELVMNCNPLADFGVPKPRQPIKIQGLNLAIVQHSLITELRGRVLQVECCLPRALIWFCLRSVHRPHLTTHFIASFLA